MYASFFGLRCLPFEDRADTHFYHSTPEFEEAVAALEYEAHYGNGLALVMGEAGTGKTLLVRTLLLRLAKTDHAVVLTWPGDGGSDLVRECCKGFGVTLSTSQNHVRRLNRLRRYLTRLSAAGERAILIVDQAENLTSEHIAELATLLDIEGEQGRLLRVFLVAQPHVRTSLDRPEFARVRQQLFGERTLPPLSTEETAAYVAHRLRIAGSSDTEIFDAAAMRQVYEASGGVPRIINRICNAAMLAAYGAGLSKVTSAIVDESGGQKTGRPAANSCQAALASAEAVSRIDEGPFVPTTEQATWPTDNAYRSWEGEGYSTSRLESVVAKAERMTATTEASLTQLSAIERHLGSLLNRAEMVSRTFGPTIQQGVEAVERTERRFGQILQQARQGAAEVEARWECAAQMIERFEDLLRRNERARASTEQLEARLRTAAEGFADQADQVQDDLSRLMDGLRGSEQAQQGLAELTARTTEITRQAERQTGVVRQEMEQAAQSASTAVDAAARRIAASVSDAEIKTASLADVVQNSVRGAEQAAQRIADEVTQRARAAIAQRSEAAMNDLKAATQRAAEDFRAAQDAIVDAASTRFRLTMQGDLGAAEASARDTMERLDNKLGEAQRREAETTRAAARIEQIRSRCDETVVTIAGVATALLETDGKLNELVSRSKNQAATVDALAAKATTAHEALRGLVAHADDKIARLASQHAAASSVIERLSGGSVAATRLVEQLATRGAAVEKTIGEAESKAREVIESATQLAASADERTQAFDKQQSEAGAKLGTIVTAVESARQAAAELAARERKATQRTGALEAQAAAAGKLIERFERTQETVASAIHVQEALGETVHHAEAVEAQLRTLTDKAAPQCDALGELSASAPAVLTRLRQVRSVARTAMDRLSSQLAAHASHLDAIDERTAQAAAQLEAIGGGLGELAERSTAISTQLASAVEQPGAVLEQVQAQSQQLERVCAAVRKVFAALSQATLDARRQADELRATGHGAAEQCSQLTRQTSKAGVVIREWVDEAVRTQTRLERTLAECPPLRSTHPGEAVRDMGRVLDHLEVEADDTMMPDPPLVAFDGEPRRPLEKPTTRSEEIARLIAEASGREADAVAGSPA